MRGDDELRRGLAGLASDVDESGAWDKVQRRAGRMRRRRRGMQAASALLVILLAVGGVLALREVLRPEPRLVIVGADSEDSAATQTTAAAEVEAPTADALLSRAISWVEEGSVRAQVSGGGADPQGRSYGAGGLPLRLDYPPGDAPFAASPIVYDGSMYHFRAPSGSTPADTENAFGSSSAAGDLWASVDRQTVAQDPNYFDGMFSWFWLFDPLLALRSMLVTGEPERLDTGDGWRIRGHVDRELLAQACPLPLSDGMLSQADGWPVEVEVGDDPSLLLRRTVVTVFPGSPEKFVLRWDWTRVEKIEFDDPASLVAGPPILPLPLLADLANVRLESYRIQGNLAKGRYPLRVLSPAADRSLVEELLRAYSQVEPPVRQAAFPNDVALRVTFVSLDGGEVDVHLRDEGEEVWISSVAGDGDGNPEVPAEEAGEHPTARAPQLATLVRELAVRNEEAPFPPLPDTRPADFGVVLAYGVSARNVLDTFAGTFTKDLISPDTPTATAVLNLTEDDLDRIYWQLRIDLSGYARIYRPDTGGVFKEPHDSYYLRVRAAGRDKEVFWADEGDSALPDAVRLRNTFEVIRSIIEQKPEVQDLPPVEGGYL
jgi:hypothetical protein